MQMQPKTQVYCQVYIYDASMVTFTMCTIESCSKEGSGVLGGLNNYCYVSGSPTSSIDPVLSINSDERLEACFSMKVRELAVGSQTIEREERIGFGRPW